MEAQLRDQMGQYMPEVLQKAIDLALKGDKLMIKMLVELAIGKPQPIEDSAEGKDKVQVTIRKLNIDQAHVELPQKLEPEIIDVEVKDV
jgi:hypothetical protein